MVLRFWQLECYPTVRSWKVAMRLLPEPWQWSEFAQALADLREAQPTRATENFLLLYANPGNVDWFDDAGWNAVADHWRLLARLAREGNMRGILFDAEPYTPPHSQFLYRVQATASEHAFAEYSAKARERGREVMQAVAAEYPNITIMTYRLFCDLISSTDSDNVSAALEPSGYGLLPAFVDGWLDVAPATVRIVEGDENAYRFNDPTAFDHAFVQLKLRSPRLVSPENRAKLRRQYDVGHGIYLDAHVNPPSSPWHIDRRGGTPAERLTANVTAALAASDGYVWIYGETGRWWPGGNQSYPTWPEKLPGADLALRRAENPLDVARETLASPDCGPNLLKNGSLAEAGANQTPADWWTWQDDRSHGTLDHQQSAAHAANATDGVFGQNVAVKPGETYIVRTQLRRTGRGVSSLVIGWKNKDGQWTVHSARYRFVAPDDVTPGDWREVLGVVQVPDEASELIFMLSTEGQLSTADQAWFQNAQLVRQ